MYKRILVPLDGSELTKAAIPYAEEVAGDMGSEITLVFVNEQKTNIAPPGHVPNQLQPAAKNEGEISLAEQYLNHVPTRSGQVKRVVLAGHPAEEIVDYAKIHDMGLIIMATHGRSGIRRWALGSVADGVVRSSAKPVLLIRAGNVPDRPKLKRILIPLDGSLPSESPIPYVEELAQKVEIEVILLEVLATGHEIINAGGYDYLVYPQYQLEADKASAQDYLGKLELSLKQKGINVRTEIRFGHAAEEIIQFSEEISADAVAMSTHGRSGITRWVMGSVSGKVLSAGTVPLLLVRPKEQG